MIYTEIEVGNIREIEERLGNLKAKAPLVMMRAMNRTVTNVKKNMGIETAKKYYITSGGIKKTVKIVKASTGRLQAAAISSGEPIALSKFKVSPSNVVKRRGSKQTPKSYKAGVEKAGGLKALDGNPKAFIAVMKSGHKGVFERTSSKKFPIKQLYGPSIPQMVKNEKIMTEIQKEANETLEKRIEAEIANILRRG